MNEIIQLINQAPELTEAWLDFVEALPFVDEPPADLNWDE